MHRANQKSKQIRIISKKKLKKYTSWKELNMNAQSVLERLLQQQASENANLQQSSTQFGNLTQHLEEEHHDSENPVFEKFLIDGGPAAIKSLSTFSIEEFGIIWQLVEQDLVAKWTTGKGRKCKVSPKDAFLMLLCVLNHYDTWNKHALDFDLKPSTFEKMIMKVMDIIEPIFRTNFINQITIAEQESSGKCFRNYPYALYATDVKFQPCCRPSGRFNEQRHYFSGKHHLYGLKVECSVAYPGVAVDLSKHHPGSVSDFTIFSQRIEVHRKMLKKSNDEALRMEHGELSAEYPDYWALLADKGYQGGTSLIRLIQPKKKTVGGILESDDLNLNARISSNSVLVKTSLVEFVCFGILAIQQINELSKIMTNSNVLYFY